MRQKLTLADLAFYAALALLCASPLILAASVR